MRHLKPLLHFRPEKNWINDANGLIWRDGWYHLFYQYNPHAPVWGDIHWGHARSRDLLHWQHLPVALAPQKEAGEDHCYSGNILISENQPYLFYTSIGPRHDARGSAEQWLALGSDDLCSWQRWAKNPLLSKSVNGSLPVYDWRDPFVWQQKGKYYMVLGGEIDGQGCVLLYQSADLFNWTSGRLLYRTDHYRGCECPNFFRLDDHWVLLFSPYDSVVAVVGQFTEDLQFIPEHEQIVDFGGNEGFYAINTLLDQQGRRIAFGWITDSDRDGASDLGLDWHGIQSLPRQLNIRDGQLQIAPAPVVRSLRKKEISLHTAEHTVQGLLTGPSEIQLDITAGSKMIKLDMNNDANELLCLEIDFVRSQIRLDRSRSSRHPDIRKSTRILPFNGTDLKLNILLDQTVIEICANNASCLTSRFYPLNGPLKNLCIRDPEPGSNVEIEARVWQLELDQMLISSDCSS